MEAAFVKVLEAEGQLPGVLAVKLIYSYLISCGSRSSRHTDLEKMQQKAAAGAAASGRRVWTAAGAKTRGAL